MSTARQHLTRTILALGVFVTVAAAAEAGPPLICHAVRRRLGAAASLGHRTKLGFAGYRSYDVTRLTADTLRLLSADAPILARMENMRRATIYAARNREAAGELMSAVMKRAASRSANRTIRWPGSTPVIWSSRIGRPATSINGTCSRRVTGPSGPCETSRTASMGMRWCRRPSR